MPVKITVKPRIKQAFCTHDFVAAMHQSRVVGLNTSKVFIMCSKCGQIKDAFTERKRAEKFEEMR